uniref:Uncharacterized protein n=1 Tax=Ditylenchus dipsaci TaxID=166011 RepID=A0A915D8R2_9BILA
MTQSEPADEEATDKSAAQQVRGADSPLHDLLKKIRLLRIDCVLLHNSIEKSLLSGGICKRYTTASKAGVREASTQETVVLSALNKASIWRSPSVSSVRSASPAFLTTASQRLTEYGSKRRRINASVWFPRRTVPEPFQMTIRESNQPHKSTYSERFLCSVLEEKRLKEEEEWRRHRERFHANPVPLSTYVPESSFYIGKLKRSRSTVVKSKSDESSKQEVKKERQFHHTPIPLSTFIRPSNSMDDLRKLRRHQRAIDLLVEACEPAGLTEHSIRWHIRNRIRHIPRCFQPPHSLIKEHSKSVPDFEKLQSEFRDKLSRTDVRPSTVVKPFSFDTNHPSHHCWNWTEAMDVELKKLRKVFEDYKSN